jgi:hypothetical protein
MRVEAETPAMRLRALDINLQTRAVARLGVVLLLLAGLGALLVWFGLPQPPAPEAGQLVIESHLAMDYDAHVGQRTAVRGTVRSVDPVVITADYEYWTGTRYASGHLDLELTGLAATVAPGDRVQVYGVVRPDGRLHVIRSVIVPDRNVLFMYAISAVAGVWVLWRLGRDWSIDWDSPGFEPRTDPRDGLTARVLNRLRG